MADVGIDEHLVRSRRELSELEALIPRTDPDGPARANLQERAEDLSKQISRVESAQEELRELEQVTAELDPDSPLRSSLAPRIAALQAELDAVGREDLAPPDAATRVDTNGRGTGDLPDLSNDGVFERVGSFLRQARAQQIASALIAVGFFLPWFDLVVFQLSGYSLVRFVLSLDQALGALVDTGDTSSMTTARIGVSVFVVLVIASVASALIPRRRARGMVSYVSNSLLLAIAAVPFASSGADDMLQAASIGLAVFGAGALLGVASGVATTLATHPTLPVRPLRLLAGFTGIAVAVVAALLLSLEEPLLAETGVAVVWFIAAAVVLIPRASSNSDGPADHLETSRTIGEWWRDRLRILLAVATSLVLLAAFGGGLWWWLTAPVEGPLEIVISQQSADRSTEDGPASVTVTSMDESVTVSDRRPPGALTWNLDGPIRVEVQPPWPTYDEQLRETLDLDDLGLTRRARGETLTVTVRFTEEASRLDVSLASQEPLLVASGNRATEEEREAIVAEQRAIEREERAAARAAAETCREDLLAVYAPLVGFREQHRRLAEQHWPQEFAFYSVWFDRATSILNGLERPIETAFSAGPTGVASVDDRAREARRAIEDLYGAWVAVRQAAQREDDSGFTTANDEVWDVDRRLRQNLTSLTSAARSHCQNES